MIKKIKWEFELIESKEHTQSYRAKVIGGWLVMNVIQDTKLKLLSHSTVFIADRDHEWVILPNAPIESSLKQSVSEGY